MTTNLQTLRQDQRAQRMVWSVASYILLAIFLAFFLFPVLWMVMTAFKPNAEITSNVAPLGILEKRSVGVRTQRPLLAHQVELCRVVFRIARFPVFLDQADRVVRIRRQPLGNNHLLLITAG